MVISVNPQENFLVTYPNGEEFEEMLDIAEAQRALRYGFTLKVCVAGWESPWQVKLDDVMFAVNPSTGKKVPVVRKETC